MKRALQLGLKLYQQAVSPWLPRSCRYTPTCSQYAIDAIEQRGVTRGSVMALWRVLRCNPFVHGGYDPVPVLSSRFSVLGGRGHVAKNRELRTEN